MTWSKKRFPKYKVRICSESEALIQTADPLVWAIEMPTAIVFSIVSLVGCIFSIAQFDIYIFTITLVLFLLTYFASWRTISIMMQNKLLRLSPTYLTINNECFELENLICLVVENERVTQTGKNLTTSVNLRIRTKRFFRTKKLFISRMLEEAVHDAKTLSEFLNLEIEYDMDKL